MKLKPLGQGEVRYAVAVREGADLWLTLWVRRSPKGEFFVFVPRTDNRAWDAHASYHLKGTFHSKSFRHKARLPKKQPLTSAFHGTEQMGRFAGYFPKSIRVACDPSAFSRVVEVAPGVLECDRGCVTVDLVEPGCEPIPEISPIVQREVFRDTVPWIVITIERNLAP